jgi:hypothetical protein
MVSLTELWLPVLLSAVFVFIASSIIHMALPVHRNDCRRLPGEEKLLLEMRAQGLLPGDYVFPNPGSMKNMGSPEMLAKYSAGPVGFVTVVPSGPPAIGKSLVQWFLFSIGVGVFAAYIAGIGLPRGSDFMTVFRVAGTSAILGYAASQVQDSIWKGRSWNSTLKYVLDGVVYGLGTGAVFAWLWPAVSA